jgi:non-ribosomal peptide synthetase component F
MAGSILAAVFVVFFGLTFVAWRRYLWVAEKARHGQEDTCPYSLTDVFGDRHLVNVPHQEGVQWLTEIFSRSARRFPDHTALQIPHTGESLTFAELDARAEAVAAALSPFLTGPDQVVAVAMAQDNWQIVASHLGILKAGGTVMFLDTTLPARGRTAGGRPHARARQLPRPADARCPGLARDDAPKRSTTMAG